MKRHSRAGAAVAGAAPAPATPKSRRGKKAIVAYCDPAVSAELKRLLLDEGRRSLQELVVEAINDLFKKYGRPPIA